MPWYRTREAAIVGLVLVGPLALPLVWFCPRFSRRAKLWITVATIVLTAALWKMTAWSLRTLSAQWARIKGDI